MVRGQSRQVGGHGLGCGGQANQAVALGPRLELTPVGAVGAAAVFGLGRLHEAARLTGQVFEPGDCSALSSRNDELLSSGM